MDIDELRAASALSLLHAKKTVGPGTTDVFFWFGVDGRVAEYVPWKEGAQQVAIKYWRVSNCLVNADPLPSGQPAGEAFYAGSLISDGSECQCIQAIG